MNNEKLKRVCYILLSLSSLCFLLFVGAKFILPVLLPFLIAWGIAFLVRPMARAVSNKCNIPMKIAAPIIAVFLLLALAAVICSVGILVVNEGWSLLSDLAQSGELDRIIGGILNPFDGSLTSSLSEELKAQLTGTLGGLIEGVLSGFAGFVSRVISGVPRMLFFILISLIATIYFCADLDNINRRILSLLPKSWQSFVLDFKATTLNIVMKYIRSYLVIMSITFALMLIGFMILRVKYAFLMALIVALLDALPLLGVGTVLVPYSIIAFISGNGALGIGLIVLYAVNEVLRQIIEPKILGKHLGLHPLLTVALLYIGYSTLGVMGIFILPIIAVALNGLIKKTKSADVEKTTTSGNE